jgi:hypothetical protein
MVGWEELDGYDGCMGTMIGWAMVGRVQWLDGYNDWMGNGWTGTMVGRVQWLDGYDG